MHKNKLVWHWSWGGGGTNKMTAPINHILLTSIHSNWRRQWHLMMLVFGFVFVLGQLKPASSMSAFNNFSSWGVVFKVKSCPQQIPAGNRFRFKMIFLSAQKTLFFLELCKNVIYSSRFLFKLKYNKENIVLNEIGSPFLASLQRSSRRRLVLSSPTSALSVSSVFLLSHP